VGSSELLNLYKVNYPQLLTSGYRFSFPNIDASSAVSFMYCTGGVFAKTCECTYITLLSNFLKERRILLYQNVVKMCGSKSTV